MRRHRDDGQLFNDVEPKVNDENLRELILLMCELENNFGDSTLSSKRNTNYLSKTTQNDLLLCVKEYIQHEIVKEIANKPEGPFYGLSAYEATGVSNWEQLGVICITLKIAALYKSYWSTSVVKISKERALQIIDYYLKSRCFRCHDVLISKVR